MYSNWAPGEPDADLNEDFVEMFATAQWNDSTDGEALNQGYLVDTCRPDRAGAADPLLIATQATAGSPGEPVVATLSLGSELLDPLASVGGERIRGNRL